MAIERRHRIMNSETIIQAGYDPASKTLELTFAQGKTYRYESVTPEQFAELMNAKSIGSHFSSTLRKSHKGEVVDVLKKSSQLDDTEKAIIRSTKTKK